jgi:hypothetical protein
MSKKFSVPLTSESVTSGQAGGVFRQLFFQCGLKSSIRYKSQLTFSFTVLYIYIISKLS